MRNVLVTNGCWHWRKYRSEKGYGRFDWRGRWMFAHRVAWELTHGPIPSGMSVCHTCDVRDCVRPDHLFLGTNADNIADKMAKGRHRARTGEDHPMHKLSTAETEGVVAAKQSGEPAKIIAARYRISESHVYRLARYYKGQQHATDA